MKNIPFLLVTAILIVLPWFWVPKGYVYTSEEPNFINYDIKLDQASTMWSKYNGFGAAGDPSSQSLLIPNAIFYSTMRNFGFDRSNTQKLFISFTFISIAIGFNLFSSLFTSNSLIRSLGLLVYLFNFYSVGAFGYTAKILQLILMPPIFYFAYKYLRTREFKYILHSYVWMFVFQGIFTNLPLAAATISVYFLAFLYYLFSGKNWVLKKALFSLAVLMLSIIPILINQFIVYRTVLDAMQDRPVLFAFTAIGAPLSLLFQLRGVWWEKSGHLGVYYFSLWGFYGHFLTVLSTVTAVGTIIFCSVKLSGERNVRSRIKPTFWLTLCLFGIGLASGFYFFPGFFQWLIDVIPLMVMFREPWAKFVPYVVLSLAAMTLVILDFFSKNNHKKYLIISLLLITHLSIQSYPFISRKIIDSEVIGWKRRLVKIPDYWEEYSKWTQKNQKVILPIPFGTTPFNSFYNWYPNNIGNTILPMPCILGKTNVICDNNLDKYSSILRSFVDKKSFDLISLGGIDLVLTQDDLAVIADWEQYSWQKDGIKEFVESNPVATFGGKLRLYQVKDQYIRPKIYATQNIMMVDENTDITGLSIKNFDERRIFIFTDISLPEIKKTVLPETSFHKISQTKYNAKITDASEPFILVFNEAYNQGWRTRLESTGNKPPHFIVNGFANGWYVDPKFICGNIPCEINLEIEFAPQKYFFIGLLVNICVFSLASVILFTLAIKKIFRKK